MATIVFNVPAGRKGKVTSEYGNYNIVGGQITADARLITQLMLAGFTPVGFENIGSYKSTDLIALETPAGYSGEIQGNGHSYKVVGGRVTVPFHVGIHLIGAGFTLAPAGPTWAEGFDLAYRFTDQRYFMSDVELDSLEEAAGYDQSVVPLFELKNMIPGSQRIGDVAHNWGVYLGSVTQAAATAPDGTTTATRYNEPAGNTASHYPFINAPSYYWKLVDGNPYLPPNGTRETFSVFAKADGRNMIYIQLNVGAENGAYFDIVNGVVSNIVNPYSLDFQTFIYPATDYYPSAPANWYRCVVVINHNFTSITLVPKDSPAGTSGSDDTKHLYLWQAQLLWGNYPDGGPIIANPGNTPIGNGTFINHIPIDSSGLTMGYDQYGSALITSLTPDSSPLDITDGFLCLMPCTMPPTGSYYPEPISLFKGNDIYSLGGIEVYLTDTQVNSDFYSTAGIYEGYSTINSLTIPGAEVVLIIRILAGAGQIGVCQSGVITWAAWVPTGASSTFTAASLDNVCIGSYLNGTYPFISAIKGTYIETGAFADDAAVLAEIAKVL